MIGAATNSAAGTIITKLVARHLIWIAGGRELAGVPIIIAGCSIHLHPVSAILMGSDAVGAIIRTAREITH